VEMQGFCTVTLEKLKADMKEFRNKDVSFAWIIIASAHKTGKNGKPYGSFTLEDYLDSMNLFLYSEDYLKWKHLLDEGTYIHIKARVEARYDSPDQMRVKVTSMTLLNEIMEKYAKNLFVTLKLSDLDEELIEKTYTLAKKNKGKCNLRIRVCDQEDELTVDLPSRKFKVNPRNMMDQMADSDEFDMRVSQE